MKILIVDDSDFLRNRLTESLKAIKNIEIIWEAKNGDEALQMMKDKNPDFIIMDLRMPGMKGIAVMKILKEQGNTSKVCIFTSYPYLLYKQKCIDEGAEYFFDKNKDFKELINIVTKLSEN